MKKRNGFTVMARLIGLVRPLAGFMALAILMGLVGHLCATFITVFGGFAVLELLGMNTPLPLGRYSPVCWCSPCSGRGFAMGSRLATILLPLSCWH